MQVISEISPGIYLGGVVAASDRELLKRLGITHILNAAVEVPDMVPSRHYPIHDHPFQDIRQYFNDSFEFIDGVVNRGGKILIHCYAGVSRSVTLLTAYYCRKYSMSPLAVLQKIAERRPGIRPNVGFLTQLDEWYNEEIQGRMQL